MKEFTAICPEYLNRKEYLYRVTINPAYVMAVEENVDGPGTTYVYLQDRKTVKVKAPFDEVVALLHEG